jgi:predicted kinase
MTAPLVRSPTVVMMCGLPAAGKTRTAARLHARAGGALIRSCDVYVNLGIRLPYWVERTRGFTVNVHEYDQLRDRAYDELARRLASELDRLDLVILDAVYGERAKRNVIYAVCRLRGVDVILLHCRCDDPAEVARRLERRRGREGTPEHEASDPSIFRDIARRWEDPHADVSDDGASPTIVTIDTLSEPPVVRGPEESSLIPLLREALHADGPDGLLGQSSHREAVAEHR